MARDGRYGRGGVAYRVVQRAQTLVGFLAVSSSNVLWIVWGWFDHAYALMVLQLALAVMNLRRCEKQS